MSQYTLKRALNYIKIGDILNIILACFVFPFAMIAKLFIRNLWLVCEDKKEARDNGYWFFKWVRENRPKQKIIYAIDKKSVDFAKVRNLGKVISYGTIAHWFWYMVADKNISSQKGGKPNAAACYLFEVVLRLRKNNRIFLQHGVTVNKGNWLFYKNTFFRLFITATIPETEYIEKNFGYPPDRVKLLGFSRYDNLNDFRVDSDTILIMPSWRNWLARDSHSEKEVIFTETDYYKNWNSLINNEQFISLLDKYNKKVLFYPHRNMQKFLSSFSSKSDRISIVDWQKEDIQEVLKRSAIMITDYSSVFFDFAYMKKPVIFYQFDEKTFREKQYSEGYFDYHNTSLGMWADTSDNVIKCLQSILEGENVPSNTGKDCKDEFLYRDNNNSLRIYEYISKL